MIQGSFMSRVNTLVVPGGKMSLAMELILTPLIKDLMENAIELNVQIAVSVKIGDNWLETEE